LRWILPCKACSIAAAARERGAVSRHAAPCRHLSWPRPTSLRAQPTRS